MGNVMKAFAGLALAAVVALAASAADARSQTSNNLKQIGIATILYEIDFLTPFPPVVDPEAPDGAIVLHVRKSGCGDNCGIVDVTYFTLAAGGGLSIADETGLRFSAFGEQLFTGSTERPTLRLGEFTFDRGRDGAPINAVLTAASVPEPASWALLIAGFGLTGAAVRRRRVGVLEPQRQ
jgi:hypothetical protein